MDDKVYCTLEAPRPRQDGAGAPREGADVNAQGAIPDSVLVAGGKLVPRMRVSHT